MSNNGAGCDAHAFGSTGCSSVQVAQAPRLVGHLAFRKYGRVADDVVAPLAMFRHAAQD